MKVKKPAWTPVELYKNYQRWERLVHETDAHDAECGCNLCMERFGLERLLQTFSQDEHAGAVIEFRKLTEGK